MLSLRLLSLLLACILIVGCTLLPNRTMRPTSPPSVALAWKAVDNLHNGGASYLFDLTFTNKGQTAWADHTWALYFNFERVIFPENVPPEVAITHLNGDFYRLTPTEKFPDLASGEALPLRFEASFWGIKITDAPDGFYFVFQEADATPQRPVPVAVEVLPFETRAQTARMPEDRVPVPTARSRYEANETLSVLPSEAVERITPTPVRVTPGTGTFALTATTPVYYEPALEAEAQFLVDALQPLLGARLPLITGSPSEETALVLAIGDVTVDGDLKQTSDAAYRLQISPDEGIRIVGTDGAGVFYGLQSLRAWLPLDAYHQPSATLALDAVTVEDTPRFGYRGFHLDVSRNFQPKAAVLKLLDLMAFYKLNTFHFHLTDDEGWRLAIDGLPELTEVGGRRGHTLTEEDHLMPSFGSGPFPDELPGSGFYSREDFVDILRYAHERHIEVIPEIDLPGHARAAIKAMEARERRLLATGASEAEASAYRLHDPEDASAYLSVQRWNDNVVNVCLPSTYRFLEIVFDDIRAMYAEAEAPLTTIHTGGDEVPQGVWTASPACDALIASDPALQTPKHLWGYFLQQVSDLLGTRGLTMGGWEEIALTEHHADGQAAKTPNPTFAGRNFRPYVWNTVWGWGGEDMAYKLANAGYQVVLSNATHLYFDFAYDKDPEEIGYYWAAFIDERGPYELIPFDLFKTVETNQLGHPLDPSAFADRERLTVAGQRNILGIQGQLWSENIITTDRLEYMAFPRLLALAERAWAVQPTWATIDERAVRTAARDTAWNAFANRLGQRELPRLDVLHGGTAYRLPLPGAIIDAGVLRANVALPGLTIRYTTDGTEPTVSSPEYTEPVTVTGPVQLKTFDTQGRSSRTTTVE